MYSHLHRGYKTFPLLPILPYVAHSDAEIIGFSDLHLHYDFRFWTDELARNVFNNGFY
jgi:hypothetical protein